MKPTITRLVLIALAFAGVATPTAAQEAESIRVERVGPDRWRATYRLSAPTAVLEFQRPATFYREQVWTVVTPGYAFAREGDFQRLQLSDGGEAAREIVVEFGEFTENLVAEYELFVAFADGGRALYTGHLYASPDGREQIRTLELSPDAGERLVIRGGVHEEALRWTDEYGDGTYAFFGSATPIESEEVIAVLDEGLPGWLRDEFDDWIPRLFDFYRDRFGVPLPWKPLVLYGFQRGDEEGLSYGGGTLTGLIQLTVNGDGWSTPSDDARTTALHFVAHEVAHLWNGQLTSNRGSDSWSHEGSADALADLVIVEFGAIPSAALRQRRETALNGCLLRLGGRSVRASRDSRVPYECGYVIALWTEAALEQAGSDADLLAFWEALVLNALDENEGDYDLERYLDVLAGFGVDDATTGAFRAAIAGDGGDAVETIVRGLRASGVTLETGHGATLAYRRELARRAFAHLMGAACGGRFSYSGVERFRTYPIDGCEPFAEEMTIEQIGGLDVGSEGAAIYDLVADACQAGETVALTGPGTSLDLLCDSPLASRPPWYSLR